MTGVRGGKIQVDTVGEEQLPQLAESLPRDEPNVTENDG